MAWKYKTDDDGHVVLKDGVIVCVDEETEREGTFDVNELHSKILATGRESKKNREELEALRKRYEPLKEIEDLEAFIADAEKAKETIKNLEEKDVRKAENVERIKNEMRQGFSEKENELTREFNKKLTDLQSQLEGRQAQIRRLMIDSRIEQHPLFGGPDPKTLMTPDAAKAIFGSNFDLEDINGAKDPRIVASLEGEPIYSRENVGELADFTEAMHIIWDRYPNRERYMRASGSGSGAGGGTNASLGKGGIASLQKQLAQAQEAGDALGIIAATNRIAEERQRMQRGG